MKLLHNKSPLAALFSILLSLALGACDKFEFNPYQTDGPGRPSNLNSKNIQRLLSKPYSNDTITVLLTGDSQRFYSKLEDLVNKANTIPNVDFLILAGDVSDFGLLQEFIWINERLEKLHFPYIAAVGNHDLIANGSEIFLRSFGPKNFSFTYKKHKFLFHDTNSREYNFNGSVPDLPWLKHQLNDTTVSWFVGVSHVPPYDEDFDRALETPYQRTLSEQPNFILSLNGHRHDTGDGFHYGDHVRYITSNAVEKTEFILLKLIDGKIIKHMIPY